MVSHDPPCQKPTHVAAAPQPSEDPRCLVADFSSSGSGEKKQVGRKRRLALSASDDDLDETRQFEEDADYVPWSAEGTTGDSDHEPATKRRHVADEADEKQSGCTDEWQLPSSPLLREDDEEEEYSSDQDDEDDNDDDEEDDDEEEVMVVPHPPPRTWVAKVEWALGRRGGKGTLADIYSTIEKAFPEEVDGKRNWKAAIRSCLSKNEKRKFYKPHSASLASGKDHLWSLVPREGAAARPPVKRGRPAGRRAAATTTRRTRHARQATTPVGHQELLHQDLEELPLRQLQNAEQQEQGLPAVLVEQFAKEERMAQLLRQKELLEQDINRLLQQQDSCGDGLSPDQEDFLSHLLA